MIPSSYSARLHPFFSILDGIGSPLHCQQLPSVLLERPDIRFSAPIVYQILEKCGASEGVPDLAYLGSCQESFGSIELKFRNQLFAAGTLKRCIDLYLSIVKKYNGRQGALLSEGQQTRICVVADPSYTVCSWLHFSDWSNIMVLVNVIRHALGRCWGPEEITLQSLEPISATARKDFPHTRILAGQPVTSLTLKSIHLATPLPQLSQKSDAKAVKSNKISEPGAFPDVLGEVLKPYLTGGMHSIDLAAEAACLNVRALQRKLNLYGLSYSDLIERERNATARYLLKQPRVKITEVSYELGYRNPTHFSRAFKRMTGLSPREFQKAAL